MILCGFIYIYLSDLGPVRVGNKGGQDRLECTELLRTAVYTEHYCTVHSPCTTSVQFYLLTLCTYSGTNLKYLILGIYMSRMRMSELKFIKNGT